MAADRHLARNGPANSIRLHPDVWLAFFRYPQPADFGPFALSIASHQQSAASVSDSCNHHPQQICFQAWHEAPFQSHQFRDRCHDATNQPDLGLTGTMGKKAILRVFHRLRRRDGHLPHGAKRCDLRFPARLRRHLVWPGVLAWRSVGRTPQTATERLSFAFRLLHDLRPEDDARFADRKNLIRDPRRGRSGLFQFGLYCTNGLLWSLALSSILT